MSSSQMEKLVVNDANIFFDLMNSGLLDKFFELPWSIHTTDFVFAEIKREEQLNQLKYFENASKLKIKKFPPEEIQEINLMYQKYRTKISLQDYSVWYYAKKISARLLTGDSKLRFLAEQEITVSGILYIFDNLVNDGIINKKDAIKKLLQLIEQNKRLPLNECQLRIDKWKSETQNK